MSEGTDEIADLVANAPTGTRKRRMATRRKAEVEEPETDPPDEPEEDEPETEVVAPSKQSTMEELDVRDMLPQQTLKPTENVKSLGDVVAKYNIGNSPEFKLQVWRTYPKIFPGGLKADGFYDTWDQPLTEELIQSEYGGGNFRIVVMGPHPTKPNTLKHYDSISLNLAGTPKYDRQPRALGQGVSAAPDLPPPSPLMMGGQENAKLSETAMKLAVDMAGDERKERIRIEERAEARAERAAGAALPAVDAERRRADDLIRAERERSETERRHMQERMDEGRAEQRKLLERIEQMEANRPSVATELEKLMPYMVRPQGDGENGGGKMAERMMESVLEKHRVEMEAIRAGHQQMIDNMNKQHEAMTASIRSSHLHELTSMRESHQRDLQMERESGARRQERADDQLKMEREERRRDQDRHRELMDSNDRTWKERIEMQLASANGSWESRHQSVVSTYETKGLWAQGEIDRLKAEVSDLRAKAVDSSDPIAIVHKAKEIREAIGGPENSGSGGGSGGGISMSGGMEDWKNLAVEGLTERAPQLLQVLGGLLQGAQQQGQQPQQQHQPGQIVQTPQGEMVVIQTPNGLALTPKAALDAAQAQSQSRMLPRQDGGGGRRRVMPDVDDLQGGGRKKRRGPVSAVPNFADPSQYGSDPLPVRGRRPPWEGGGAADDDGGQQDRRRTSAPEQRRTSQPAQQPQQQAQPQQRPPERIARQMTAQERQGLGVLAKVVHDAVMNADEPEEFTEKVLKEWPPDMLRQIISGYSPDDIARAIIETKPGSAGATPAGQAFVRTAFSQIERALR